MNNLFEILPLNFFNIFNTPNKLVVSDCLFVLYDYMKEDTTFASLNIVWGKAARRRRTYKVF